MSQSSAPIRGSGGVQRQIVLPLSKAVEIAWKNIRMRLSRSLLVTSGIVLALAFLMSILTTDALTDSMRNWAMNGPADSAAGTLAQRHELERLMTAEGVPMTETDIAGSRIQTRWLLGLALLVALVGILNAMLMSVTERFREIGTMKCLGALDSFIVKLFLLESLFQGLAGTLIGIGLGMILSIVSIAAAYGHYAWIDPPVTRLLASIGLSLAIGVGLTAAGAVYPAWQAARMQPIEAMRVET